MYESGYHVFIDGNTGLVNVKAQRTTDNKIELIQIQPVDSIRYEIGGADVTLDSPVYTTPIEASIVRFAGVRNGELLEKVLFVNKAPDVGLRVKGSPGRKLYGIVGLQTNNYEMVLDTSTLLYKTRPTDLPMRKQIMAYHEIELGLYLLPIPIDVMQIDGQYKIYVVEESNGNFITAGSPVIIKTGGGKIISDSMTGKVVLNHNYERPGTFTYVSPEGKPVEGAIIRVFKKSDYDVGLRDNPVGRTLTNEKGEWENDILVESGEVYYIIFHKEGYYGPDKVEVNVTGSAPLPPVTPPPHGTRIYGEVVPGVDGNNRIFYSKYPYIAGTLIVFLNGLRLTKDTDYTEVSDTSFLMSSPPLAGSTLVIEYNVK